jgi:hypothetical protein
MSTTPLMSTTPRQKAKILHWWTSVRDQRGEPYDVCLRMKFNWPSITDDEAKQVMEEYMALIPKHLVRCELGLRLYVEKFDSTNAAALFVNAMLSDDKIKWVSPTCLTAKDGNLIIQSDDLEQIIEFKTSDERKLPEEKRRQIEQFLHGKWRKVKNNDNQVEDTGDDAKTPTKGLQGSKRSGVASTDDMTTLADICQRLKIEPRKARAYLRKKHEANDGRWAWAGRDVAVIEKLLRSMK